MQSKSGGRMELGRIGWEWKSRLKSVWALVKWLQTGCVGHSNYSHDVNRESDFSVRIVGLAHPIYNGWLHVCSPRKSWTLLAFFIAVSSTHNTKAMNKYWMLQTHFLSEVSDISETTFSTFSSQITGCSSPVTSYILLSLWPPGVSQESTLNINVRLL